MKARFALLLFVFASVALPAALFGRARGLPSQDARYTPAKSVMTQSAQPLVGRRPPAAAAAAPPSQPHPGPSVGASGAGSNASTASSAVCQCRLRGYGLSGHWVPSSSTQEQAWVLKSFPKTAEETKWMPRRGLPQQYEWLDDECGVVPEFDARRFCQEALGCSSMLIVGDSTSVQVYEVLATALGHTDCAPFRRNLGNKRCGPARELPCAVCEAHCARPVRITFFRHDHLDGPDFVDDPKVKNDKLCNHWRTMIDDYEYLLLSTGSHVNDAAEYNSNEGHNWEKGMTSLLNFLKERHPRNVLWRTCWYGINETWRTPCPGGDHMRAAPRQRHEISENYRDSWKHISDFNTMFRSLSAEQWPGGVAMLDVENMLGMRSDCRMDHLHFHLGVGSAGGPLWFLPRMMQHHLLAAREPACLL